MAYKKGILLGQITKTTGFEGSVIVRLEKKFIENIPLMESVFLEIEGKPVPFFIASSEYAGADILKLSFADYESVEKAEEFRGCNVYLTSGPEVSDDESYSGILGYTVADQSGQTVGKIEEIIENPGQLLLRIVSAENKELLLPLHEDLVIKLEKRKRRIIMELPEGITDL